MELSGCQVDVDASDGSGRQFTVGTYTKQLTLRAASREDRDVWVAGLLRLKAREVKAAMGHAARSHNEVDAHTVGTTASACGCLWHAVAI